MKYLSLLKLMLIVAVVSMISGVSVFGQGRIVGSISGVVEDPNGAAVPNATVLLKDIKTGLTKQASTTDSGTYYFPDLAIGAYEISVTANGFRKTLITNVVVSTGQTTDVKAALMVGEANATVTVASDTGPVLETSSTLVANTLTTQTVTELPLSSRSNPLALARLAPGAQPPTGGSTRYNNLPGGAMNITIDGINDASNGFKSGGTVFFMTVPVRLGALDEISVETGGLSAESGGQSGANIKFTTRRGGQHYHGSGFYETTNETFNANSWSRNAQGLGRAFNRSHNFGGNIGGPIIPFGSWKKKAFFFINIEDQYSPINSPTTISVLTPEARQGIYKYIVSGTTNQVAQVNVLTLAAAKNLPVTLDPVVQSILAVNDKIPANANKVAGTDLNRNTYSWNAENNQKQFFPTVRFDAWATKKHQVIFTWNLRRSWQPGARRLPVPDVQRTNPFLLNYWVWSIADQATITNNFFNEIRYGRQHSGDSNARAEYGSNYTYNNIPLRIGATLPFGPLVPFIDQQNVTGRHNIPTFYDNATWNHGQHSIGFGFTYRRTNWFDTGEILQLPTYGTGTPSGDPLNASTAYTTTTLPGINTTTNPLTDPLALYNLLVGRVSSASFTKVVNPDGLKYNGFINYTWTTSAMGGIYVQDRWRMRPSLTLSYGGRWEGQGPMHDPKGIAAAPDLSSILGPSRGNNNPQLTAGYVPYKRDFNNFAPSGGFAWNPTYDKGWLGKIFGGSSTVIRGNMNQVFYDEGTQMFAQNIGTNIGKTIAATALVPGVAGATNLPAFYTLANVVANPLTSNNFAFSVTDYKTTVNQADQTFSRTISGFDPTIRTPYTINWSFGVQRGLWKNTVIEARYVGNHSHLNWRTSNINEVDIFSNGFLQEFKNAQNNYNINHAAGVESFQNLGRAGQVNLPIFDTAFGARGGLTAIAAGSGYQSGTFITNLQNGAAGSLATTLATNQNYVCRMFGSSFSPCARVLPTANVPGPYPLTFFLPNPFVAGSLNYVDDTGWNSYNGMQIQFRTRLKQGLTWTTNYTWSHSFTNEGTADNANTGVDFTSIKNPGLDKRPSPFDIRHVIQNYGTYELPFGRGKWLNFGDNRILNDVLGGWTLGTVLVFQTGVPVQLTGGFATVNNSNNPATGGVRLAPGVTLEQIQKMFNAPRIRITGRAAGTFTDLQRIAVDPALIGPDGRANPAFITWNTTPGDFGQLLFVRDRPSVAFDASLTKTYTFMEKTKVQLFAGFNNVTNHQRWGLPNTNVNSTTFGIVGAPGPVSISGTGGYGRSINLRATVSY